MTKKWQKIERVGIETCQRKIETVGIELDGEDGVEMWASKTKINKGSKFWDRLK